MPSDGRFRKGQKPWNARNWSEIDTIIRARYPAEGASLAKEICISRSMLYLRASYLGVRCLKRQVSTPESRAKTAVALKGRTKGDTWRQRLSAALKGRKHDSRRRAAIICGLVASRKKPRCMSKPESRVLDVLRSMFGQYNPYQYTGDRKFWLKTASGKDRNPDFTSASQKKIIEVFGRYWHRNDDPQKVVEDYAGVGWECLILWEDEIGAEMIDRVMEFTYPAEYWHEYYETMRVA